MTVYFAGTEIMDFTVVEQAAGNVHTETGGSTTRHTANTRCDILVPGSTTSDVNYLDCPFSSAQTAFWGHWSEGRTYASPSTSLPWVKLRSSGVDVFTLRIPTTSGMFAVSQWNGSSWTDILTSSTAISGNALHDFDWHIVLGNPGTIAVYVDGVPIMSNTSLDLSGITSIDTLRLQGFSVNFSEVIVADWNTINARIISNGPTGAGNYSDWTNTYTNVDEFTDGGTDYITSGTADQRQSFTFPAISLGAGESIAAVGVSAEGFSDTSSPQSINLFARVNATDYDDVDQSLPTAMSFTTPKIWEDNPDTSGIAWDTAGVNAAEFGVRSRT